MAEPITATLTQGMSGTEAKALLDSLGINVNDVLSSSNIQQATTAPVTNPDDLLGIRRDIYNQAGVSTAQQAYQTATKAYQDAQNQLNTSNLQLRNRPVSVSKFTGQMGQNTMVNEQNINNLSDAASLALQNYQATKSEADTQFGIRNQQLSETKALMVQYPGAGIKFSDSTESQVKKLSEYQKQVEKDAYKKELKKIALQYGINTKGKSTKDLEKKIAKYNKSVIKDAKEESKLKLEALKMDIANTRSTIANRGSESKIKSVPYYTVNPTTGELQQAFNDDGSPVMIPSNAQIQTLKTNDDAALLESLSQGEDSQESGVWNNVKNWFSNIWK